jgi:hypothetical protein
VFSKASLVMVRKDTKGNQQVTVVGSTNQSETDDVAIVDSRQPRMDDEVNKKKFNCFPNKKSMFLGFRCPTRAI